MIEAAYRVDDDTGAEDEDPAAQIPRLEAEIERLARVAESCRKVILAAKVAIVLGALTVGLIKIGACVVARLVYGPDYIAQGYVSADWQTAKLMISLMWTGTLLISVFALVACHRRFAILDDDG